jgi:hypothetical protein
MVLKRIFLLIHFSLQIFGATSLAEESKTLGPSTSIPCEDTINILLKEVELPDLKAKGWSFFRQGKAVSRAELQDPSNQLFLTNKAYHAQADRDILEIARLERELAKIPKPKNKTIWQQDVDLAKAQASCDETPGCPKGDIAMVVTKENSTINRQIELSKRKAAIERKIEEMTTRPYDLTIGYNVDGSVLERLNRITAEYYSNEDESDKNKIKSEKIKELLALGNILPKDSLPKGLQTYIKSLHPELKTLKTRFADLKVRQDQLLKEIDATKKEIKNGSLISFSNFSKYNNRGPSIDIIHKESSFHPNHIPQVPFIDMKSCKFGSADLRADPPKTFDSLFDLCIDRSESNTYHAFCSPKMPKYCLDAENDKGIKLENLPNRCHFLKVDKDNPRSRPSQAPAR